MDVERAMAYHIDIPSKLGQFSVDLGFVFPPIVAVLPSFNEPSDIRQGNPVVPACIVQFVWKLSQSQLLAKLVNAFVWDRDFVNGFSHGSSRLKSQIQCHSSSVRSKRQFSI
jgi:hypothetical protein